MPRSPRPAPQRSLFPPPAEGSRGELRCVGLRPRTAMTRWGEIDYQRPWFAPVEGGEGCSPLDAALGLRKHGGYTRGARRLMVYAGALSGDSFAAASEMLREVAGLAIDASEIERECVAAGQEALCEQPARDAEYLRPEAPGESVAEKAHDTVGCTMDGTMYLEQEGRRGPKPRKTASPKQAGAGAEAPVIPTGPRTRGREVKVAMVFGLDDRIGGSDGRPALLDRRVAASTEGIGSFAPRLKALLCRWGFRKARRVFVIGDGALWIWLWVIAFLGEGAIQILDFWHAKERLVELGNIIHGAHSEQARAFAAERAERLRKGQVQAVAAELRELAARDKEGHREAILEVAGYYENNRLRMDYPRYEREGLPIGSGSVESLGKSLVQSRLRGPGKRWEPKGAAAVVALRELHANQDLEAFWERDRERLLKAA